MTKHLRVFEVRNFFDFEISQDESIESRFVSFEGTEFHSLFTIDSSPFNEHHLQLSADKQYLPSSLTVASFLHIISFFSDKCTLRSERGLHLKLTKISKAPVSFDFTVVESEGL
ncbi:hypothetical protein GNP80_13615 [Aliivibrio fischeri]|nr:hypothetical protein [Aliivibrio fischeri]MUK93470.1 hypothetical protein [Aliivibrio fischeri]